MEDTSYCHFDLSLSDKWYWLIYHKIVKSEYTFNMADQKEKMFSFHYMYGIRCEYALYAISNIEKSSPISILLRYFIFYLWQILLNDFSI